MDIDARWQQDLVAALHLESLFISSGLAFPQSEWADPSSPLTRRVLVPWKIFGNGGAICPKPA
jgi:hypothetical protein